MYFYNVSNTQFNDTDNKCVYGSVEALGTIPKGEVKFDKTADNSFVNLEFKIQFKVDLIQSNNLDDIDDLGDMSAVENYQALFTYYD
ncbi:MAG TPA: hypothetical protein DCO89_02300 [Clostridiales bacterium]|nr:hypothetical protein [Clostridiales bacterium]